MGFVGEEKYEINYGTVSGRCARPNSHLNTDLESLGDENADGHLKCNFTVCLGRLMSKRAMRMLMGTSSVILRFVWVD